MKLKIKIPAVKPRNALVPEMFKLKSGSHEKPEKALRRQLKIDIKNNIDKEFDK